VRDVGLARPSNLTLVGLNGRQTRPANQFDVVGRVVLEELTQ
jgi:hypothetical protein